jgi:hypothetical protein
MEIVEKVIAPRLQWPQPDNSFAVSGHDLLHTQTHALDMGVGSRFFMRSSIGTLAGAWISAG